MDDEILTEINNELERLGALKLDDDIDKDEDLPQIEEIKPVNRRKRGNPNISEMAKLGLQAKQAKAKAKQELKQKQEEVMRIKQEKINIEYEEAQRLKEALEIKKKKLLEEQEQKEIEKKNPQRQIIKENKNLIKTSSRDILKEQFLMEAKRRLMNDLFS